MSFLILTKVGVTAGIPDTNRVGKDVHTIIWPFRQKNDYKLCAFTIYSEYDDIIFWPYFILDGLNGKDRYRVNDQYTTGAAEAPSYKTTCP